MKVRQVTYVMYFMFMISLINVQNVATEQLRSDNTEKIMCYTCMSDNVPEISKHIMGHTINLPDYAETSICNDPFSFSSVENLQKNVKMEECDTACVKVVSENKYLKIVMRGCLNKLHKNEFSPMTNFYNKELQENCNLQQSNSVGLGDTVTGTCVCRTNFCNKSNRMQINFIICIFCFVTILLNIVV